MTSDRRQSYCKLTGAGGSMAKSSTSRGNSGSSYHCSFCGKNQDSGQTAHRRARRGSTSATSASSLCEEIIDRGGPGRFPRSKGAGLKSLALNPA